MGKPALEKLLPFHEAVVAEILRIIQTFCNSEYWDLGTRPEEPSQIMVLLDVIFRTELSAEQLNYLEDELSEPLVKLENFLDGNGDLITATNIANYRKRLLEHGLAHKKEVK